MSKKSINVSGLGGVMCVYVLIRYVAELCNISKKIPEKTSNILHTQLVRMSQPTNKAKPEDLLRSRVTLNQHLNCGSV